jgi:uncharacterized protein HemY
MTTKQDTSGDDAATLYALADALHKRANAQYREALLHARAGEWDDAEKSMTAARTTKTAANELTEEADAS